MDLVLPSLINRPADAAPRVLTAPSLVIAACHGDPDARRKLVLKHQDLWLRFCATQLGKWHLAEDAAQETALRSLQMLHRLRQPQDFTPWSMGIARNICREQQRKQRRQPLSVTADIRADGTDSPDERVSQQEAAQALHLHLRRLPERQRIAVTLRHLAGMSVADTAKAMRCRQGTIKSLTRHGLDRLRKHLEATHG